MCEGGQWLDEVVVFCFYFRLLSLLYLGLEVVYRGYFETILLCHQANSTLADRPGVRTMGCKGILLPTLKSEGEQNCFCSAHLFWLTFRKYVFYNMEVKTFIALRGIRLCFYANPSSSFLVLSWSFPPLSGPFPKAPLLTVNAPLDIKRLSFSNFPIGMYITWV